MILNKEVSLNTRLDFGFTDLKVSTNGGFTIVMCFYLESNNKNNNIFTYTNGHNKSNKFSLLYKNNHLKFIYYDSNETKTIYLNKIPYYIFDKWSNLYFTYSETNKNIRIFINKKRIYNYYLESWHIPDLQNNHFLIGKKNQIMHLKNFELHDKHFNDTEAHKLFGLQYKESPLKGSARNLKYKNNWQYHIAECKVRLAREHRLNKPSIRIHQYNYKEILDEGVRTGIINALRLPIIAAWNDPSEYIDVKIHEDFIKYATYLGLTLFANCMPSHKGIFNPNYETMNPKPTNYWIVNRHWSTDKLITWILNYLNYFKEKSNAYIEYLGIWNEPYYFIDQLDMIEKTNAVRNALKRNGYEHIKLVGPCEVNIEKTIMTLTPRNKALEAGVTRKQLSDLFDVISSHTQLQDVDGNYAGWLNLKENYCFGKPLWNSEGKTLDYENGDLCEDNTRRPALKELVDAGGSAWCYWLTYGQNMNTNSENHRLIYCNHSEITKHGLNIVENTKI